MAIATTNGVLYQRTKLAEHGTLPDLLTTLDTVVDVGTWDVFQFITKHLVFTAATNNLLVTILGSIDGGVTYPLTAEAEFAVNAGATVMKTLSVFYTHLKVQVRPAVAATHGTLTTGYAGAAFY